MTRDAIDPGREVVVEANGARYTLYCGNRALRLLEREYGASTFELFARWDESPSLGMLTTFVWALLQTRHPDLTVEEVDSIIDALGYERTAAALGDALARVMPPAAGTGPAGQGKGRGTGTQRTPPPSSRASDRTSSGS